MTGCKFEMNKNERQFFDKFAASGANFWPISLCGKMRDLKIIFAGIALKPCGDSRGLRYRMITSHQVFGREGERQSQIDGILSHGKLPVLCLALSARKVYLRSLSTLDSR